MKKLLKTVAFLLCFCAIFLFVQEIFINSMNEETTKNSGFYDMPNNSVDVLFLGSSQMFCSINAQKLTKECGISAFDFGSNSEPLPAVYYYLQEALKYQTPKVVGVEVVEYFDGEINYIKIARSYLTMPLSLEKYESLKTILDGNQKEAALYCFIPLFAYHSLWNQINPVKAALSLVTSYAKTDNSLRGFVERDHIEPSEIAYLQDEEGEYVTPNDKGIKAISDIANLCEEKGIKLFFFKAPSNVWTRTDSKVVKEFMKKNGLTYFEMNDYLDEIGIDGNTDFYDSGHLNTTGASKATAFMEKYLMEHYNLSA